MREMTAHIAESILSGISRTKLKEHLVFMGIQVRGVPLAEKIAAEIKRITGFEPPVATLDINMYRDDIGIRKTLPRIHPTSVPYDLDGKILVLVDDVLHTGRTIRAALDAVTDYGRPDLIRLAVLIDRGGHEFPVKADYIGEKYPVPDTEHVAVRWQKTDNETGVYILPGRTGKGEFIK